MSQSSTVCDSSRGVEGRREEMMRGVAAGCVVLISVAVGSSAQTPDKVFGLLNAAAGNSLICRAEAATQEEFWVLGESCGSLEKPCLAGMIGVVDDKSAECGKCYIVTHKSAEITSAHCTGGTCPAWEKTVLVKVETQTNNASANRVFDVNPAGWKMVCPWGCPDTASGFCVQEKSACVGNIADDTAAMPQSSLGAAVAVDVAWVEADCATGAATGTVKPAGATVGPIPTTTSTTSTTTTTPTITTTPDAPTSTSEASTLSVGSGLWAITTAAVAAVTIWH